MAGEWQEIPLSQIAKLRSGFPFKSASWTDSGVPVIKIANIKGGRIVPDGCGYVSPDTAATVPEWETREGDVLIAMTGYVGEIALVRPGEKYLINQRVGRFEFLDSARVIPKFLFFYLSQPEVRSLLETMARGSAQPNLSARDIELLRVPVPPIAEQRAIAHILGTLDDKIELNRKQNETLEAMARALFKAWFVDFEPVRAKMEGRWQRGLSLPGLPTHLYELFPDRLVESELGEIPEGWRVGPVYEIASVRYGAPFASSKFNSEGKGQPLVRIRDLRNERPGVWTEEVHPKGYLIQPGDIVVGMDGEFRAYLWGGEPAWMNQRICVFHPNNPHCAAFVRNAIEPHLARVEATEVATTVIHLGKGDIDEFQIVIPGDDVAIEFEKLCQPNFDQIVLTKQQSSKLAQLRDTLLPKLISGELRVPDAEAFLGEHEP